jgi:catechol 2,3-dioxygenase-like lactoylglutathione lyase family enzyme
MLDHVSITVSDIAAAERFYDAIMNVLNVVKVGHRPDWSVTANGRGQPTRSASISRS